MASEKVFENKVKAYLKSIGAYFIKTHGDRFSKKGMPDIYACVNGHFVGNEVKVDHDPTELQLHHLKKIRLSGGYGVICCPKEEIKRIKDYILKNFPEYFDTPIISFEKFKRDMESLRGGE